VTSAIGDLSELNRKKLHIENGRIIKCRQSSWARVQSVIDRLRGELGRVPTEAEVVAALGEG
jgi:DNA-directed RNA polymerase specialized sigma subunit